MKSFLLFLTLVAIVVAEDVTEEKNCKCWEEYKPEKVEGGNTYYCRGEKTQRIFGCGEEKPPICKCQKNGKTIELDLGMTDCLSVDLQNGRWCQNKDEFIEYFKKHPEHAIYD